MSELQQILSSLNEIKTDIKEIKSAIDATKKNIEAIHSKQEYLEDKLNKQEQLLQGVFKKLRKKNLIIFGLFEDEQSINELEEKVLDLISNKLKINFNLDEIDYVTRISKRRSDSSPRPVIVALTTWRKKRLILSKAFTLKEYKIYIDHDLTPDERNERKILKEQASEYRKKGYKVKIKNNKLSINGKISNNINNATEKNKNKRSLEGVSEPELNIIEQDISQSSKTRRLSNVHNLNSNWTRIFSSQNNINDNPTHADDAKLTGSNAASKNE